MITRVLNSTLSMLVVDDEASLRSILADTFRDDGHVVLEAGNGLEALEQLETRTVDIVLTDIRMPHMDGLELIVAMKARGLTPPTIVITGYGDMNVVKTGLKHGVLDFIEKPFDLDLVKHRVQVALYQLEIRRLEGQIFAHMVEHFAISTPKSYANMPHLERIEVLRTLLDLFKLRTARIETQMLKTGT